MLELIVEAKREEVARLKSCFPLSELQAGALDAPPARDFLQAVQRKGRAVSLIAELKKASPSRDLICPDFDPCLIAGIYEEAGASAISVLTDERFFGGRPEYLSAVRGVTGLPLLCKDFIISDLQLYRARLLGADAVLLIAAILEQGQLFDYLALAEELGMAALVEVHTELELFRALESGAVLLGINNRDLYTFQVDLGVTLNLLPCVPEGRIVVSESGIKRRADVELLAEAGVDAVLVGEALAGAPEIRGAVLELMGRDGGLLWSG